MKLAQEDSNSKVKVWNPESSDKHENLNLHVEIKT